MWSRWAWVMNKKFCWTALGGHLPMSKAHFSWGTTTQVSWPPTDIPSNEYPSTSIPFRFTSARAFRYSSSSITLSIADKNPPATGEGPLTAAGGEIPVSVWKERVWVCLRRLDCSGFFKKRWNVGKDGAFEVAVTTTAICIFEKKIGTHRWTVMAASSPVVL